MGGSRGPLPGTAKRRHEIMDFALTQPLGLQGNFKVSEATGGFTCGCQATMGNPGFQSYWNCKVCLGLLEATTKRRQEILDFKANDAARAICGYLGLPSDDRKTWFPAPGLSQCK